MNQRALMWSAVGLLAGLLAGCASPSPSVLIGPTFSLTPASAPPPTSGSTPGQSPSSPSPSMATFPIESLVPSSQPAEPIAACDLLFRDEAAASLGVTIDSSAPADGITITGVGWYSTCTFDRLVFYTITPLELYVASGDKYMADFRMLRYQGDTTSLAGLGDEAFLRIGPVWGLDEPVGAVFARAGNIVLGLTLGIVDVTTEGRLVVAGDRDRQQQILVDLAGIALGRLISPPVEAANTCDLLGLDEAIGMVGLPLISAEPVDAHDEWGPACHFKGNDGFAELFVSVDERPTARAHFDGCRSLSDSIASVGDEAFYTRQCPIKVGFRYMNGPLMARAADTIVSVGEAGALEYEQARKVLVDVARLVLERLRFTPEPSAPPVSPSPTAGTGEALTHPCALITDEEVAATVGTFVSSHTETSADAASENAACIFINGEDNLQPLQLRLGRGPNVLAEFSSWSGDSTYTPVNGIGDAALTSQYAGLADQPLVNLFVRTGDTVLELYLGGWSRSADGTVLAPSDSEGQLLILQQLAELILPRVTAGPG